MSNTAVLAGARILLGVTGGIAAYKAPLLVRGLRKEGAEVRVVLTRSATQFVTPLTLEALCGSPPLSHMFGDGPCMAHIDWPRDADLMVIAPATANCIGKMAHGIADDLLSTMVLAADCPCLIAPAMNTRMLTHPAVVQNLGVLRGRDVQIVDPGTGDLACGDTGEGRMAEVEEIVAAVTDLWANRGKLAGKRVLVSAGPTVEPIDPFRMITNRSSGKMGYALAEEAAKMGASVTLISGPTALTPPARAAYVEVETAAEMAEAVNRLFPDSHVLIMAAAVGDFRVAVPSPVKIKKSSIAPVLELIENPDILKGLGGRNGGQVVVGFAAETGDLLEEGRRKLKEKGVDLIVANDVGRKGSGFGSDFNRVLMIDGAGGVEDTGLLPKKEIARRILKRVSQDFL